MSIIALNWKWFVDKAHFLLDSNLESRSRVLIIRISQVLASSWHLFIVQNGFGEINWTITHNTPVLF